MTKRRVPLILAGVFALAMSLLVAAPAQASQVYTTCRTFPVNDRSICIYTEYKNHVGATGITIYSITIQIHWDNTSRPPEDFFETKAFDCDALRVWTEPNDVVKWRRDGAQCDVYAHDQARSWILNGADGLNMPNAPEVDVSLAGWPKLNNAQDPGRVVLTSHLMS